jgi:hypothetical protein
MLRSARYRKTTEREKRAGWMLRGVPRGLPRISFHSIRATLACSIDIRAEVHELWFAPLVSAADTGIADTFDKDSRLGIELFSFLDRLFLRWRGNGGPLGASPSDRVIAFDGAQRKVRASYLSWSHPRFSEEIISRNIRPFYQKEAP